MKTYVAYIVLAEERIKVVFTTDILPVEYLWQRYGMSTYIESVVELPQKGD